MVATARLLGGALLELTHFGFQKSPSLKPLKPLEADLEAKKTSGAMVPNLYQPAATVA